MTGDLLTGAGIEAAVTGLSTVVHLATGYRRKDAVLAQTLLDAARPAGVVHVVLVSIVGIDRIPLGYYRDKVPIERLVTESGGPYTILRATQFHTLVEQLLSAQRRLPVLLAPSPPAGRVPDIGARCPSD